MGTTFSSSDGRPKLEGANSEIEEDIAQKVGEAAKKTVSEYLKEKNEEFIRYKRQYEEGLQRKCHQLEERNNVVERKYNDLKDEHERLKNEIASERQKLKQLQKQLEIEKEQLRDQREEVLGLTGLGLRGRKMHGDVAPGDLTHGDIAAKYKEYFKYHLRHFPNENPNIERLYARQAIPVIFQKVFAATTETVLDILREILQELLQDPAIQRVDDSDIKTKERHHDIATAYSLLLYHSHLKGEESVDLLLSQKIMKKIAPDLKSYEKEGIVLSEEFLQETAGLSINMLTLTPPQLVSMPKGEFDKSLHEKQYSTWKVEEGPYDLVYLRPVLFNGRHGAVAVVGQVGNIPKPAVKIDTVDTEMNTSSRPGVETDPLQTEPVCHLQNAMSHKNEVETKQEQTENMGAKESTSFIEQDPSEHDASNEVDCVESNILSRPQIETDSFQNEPDVTSPKDEFEMKQEQSTLAENMGAKESPSLHVLEQEPSDIDEHDANNEADCVEIDANNSICTQNDNRSSADNETRLNELLENRAKSDIEYPKFDH